MCSVIFIGNDMQSTSPSQKLALACLILFSMIMLVDSSPTIGICIRNCAQCKKMFGPYFEGQLCADACVKFRGKIIPDCEDLASISPFLNKYE